MELKFLFKCKKCRSLLVIDIDDYDWLDKPKDCPICGEDPEDNWLYQYIYKVIK